MDFCALRTVPDIEICLEVMQKIEPRLACRCYPETPTQSRVQVAKINVPEDKTVHKMGTNDLLP